ncbi:AAA family ATPase [Weissella cibaria]|uniref:Nuclease SbcCD subunit C n=1 Tax=Weissella cibaria TaxID=137591 RepID=A0A0D1JM32_9LACO|nr:SMC family ATPase [Weissella cibaria]KIU22393.1 Nuclease SbcCD subunit C [Weissella cibaria]
MRPIKLALQYFGPYEQTTVDFERFTESKLFLITGDTGAGKTTMFDGMTYALFGEGTSERKPEEMRSEFAPITVETAVTFWFEHNGRYYRISRKPTQQLKKKRGAKSDDDTTERKAEVSLTEVDETLQVPIAAMGEKIPVVRDAIQELLHLNADQFRKIILLPQNQFREFLAAQSDDKMTILRSLFGTEVFNQFTESLKEQQKETLKQVTNLETQRDVALSQIAWDDPAIADSAPTAVEKITALTAYIARLTDIVTARETEKAMATTAVAQSQERVKTAEQLNRQFELLAENTAKQQLLDEQADQINEQRQQATLLQWGNQQQSIVNDVTRYEEQLARVATELTQLATREAATTHSLSEAAATKTELLTQAADIETAEARLKRITRTLLPNAQRLAMLITQATQLAQQRQTLQTNEAQLTAQLAELTAKEVELQTSLATVASVSSSREQLLVFATQADELHRTDERLQQTEKKVAQQAENLMRVTRKLDTAKANLQDVIAMREAKATLRRELMIKQLHSELKIGEVCMVCGQIYTGEGADPHVGSTSYAEIKVAMAAVDEAETAEQQAIATEASLTTDATQTKQQYDTLAKQLASERDGFASEYNQFFTAWATVFPNNLLPDKYDTSTVQTVIAQVRQHLSDQVTKQEQLTATLATVTEEIASVKTNLARTQTQLSGITTQLAENDSEQHELNSDGPLSTVSDYEVEQQALTEKIATYQQAVQSADEKIRSAEQTQQELSQRRLVLNQEQNTYQTALDEAKGRLGIAITDGPVVDEQALQALLDRIQNQPDELIQLERQLAAYDTERKTVATAIAQSQALTAGQERPDLSQLQAELTQKQTASAEATERLNKAEWLLEALQQQQTTILKLQTDIDAITAKSADLIKLTQAVDGNNLLHLRLEPYVLRSFLYEVLTYANEHYIGTLSGGRYQFVLSSRQAGRANQNGLDIDIYDQDGVKVRSTSTLSGGESFIAALSIALSMAEIVQRRAGGAKIDALFIDEGFGSLDSNTLNQALEALSMVEQSGRLIGVISHVESMKRQIQQQMVVAKLGDGRSRLTYRMV